MLKLAVAALAVALAGTAAAGWRDLRVDGSSEEAFAQSLAAFKKELSPARQFVFGETLKDIWIQGETAAGAEQRDYTDDEYYKLLDGLRYEDVVNYTDPSGDTAKRRYRSAAQSAHRSQPIAPGGNRTNDTSAEHWINAGVERGGTDLVGTAGQP